LTALSGTSKTPGKAIPEFPMEGKFMPRFVEWAAKTTDAPLQFLAAGALMAMSAAVGRQLVFNNRLHPNIWLAILGESTLMRKSTTISITREICEKAGIQIFPDRLTPESFYESMCEHPQGLFALSELGGWLGSLNRSYAIGFKQDMTELYDCPVEFRRNRKNHRSKVVEFKITHPYICIFGASTLNWFENHVKDDDSNGGFLPRFQFVLGTQRKPYAIPPNLELPEDLIEYLRSISHTKGNIQLEPGDKAYNTYTEWFNGFRKQLESCSPNLIPYGNRIEIAALKFAVLFEADRNPGKTLKAISNESIESGCRLADHFFKNAQIVLEQLGFSQFEKTCQRILQIIENEPGVTQRNILRNVCIPKNVFNDAITYLTDSGKVTAFKKSGKGRPTVKFFPEW